MRDLPLVTPFLDVRGVTLQYKTKERLVTATYRVDFQVFRSDRYVLLGPSGCGKSTLLKAVGGYLRPTEGEITLKGEAINKPGPDRMMVFQEFDQLLPWKSVLDNVMFPLLASGRLRGRAARDKAMQYVEKVNLADFADCFPHMLSGGMKQRVAIARGMAMEPDIFLMDEPYAALDALTRRKMQDELLQLWDDTHFTVLFTDPHVQAVSLVNDIIHPSEGRIRSIRPPIQFSETPMSVRRHAPRLGEQTEDILREVDYADSEIELFLESSIVKQARNH